MNTAAKLERWGVVEVFPDLRGAVIETRVRSEVVLIKRRQSFTVQCLDCGPAEHVSVDDESAAVCLRCGRDRWL